MGREVKRVPLEFDWPQNERWWGYTYGYTIQKRLEELGEPKLSCGTCHGTGKVAWRTHDWSGPDDGGKYYCPHCEGEKTPFFPHIDPPEGEGWQMWETTSEGSPISPVFETPEQLAKWLADTGASTFGPMTTTYEAWLGMIEGIGHSLAGVVFNTATGEAKSGVDAAAGVKR